MSQPSWADVAAQRPLVLGDRLVAPEAGDHRLLLRALRRRGAAEAADLVEGPAEAHRVERPAAAPGRNWSGDRIENGRAWASHGARPWVAGGVGVHTPGPGSCSGGTGPRLRAVAEPVGERATAGGPADGDAVVLAGTVGDRGERLGQRGVEHRRAGRQEGDEHAVGGGSSSRRRRRAGGCESGSRTARYRPSIATTASYIATCMAATTNGCVSSGRPDGVSTPMATAFHSAITAGSRAGSVAVGAVADAGEGAAVGARVAMARAPAAILAAARRC